MPACCDTQPLTRTAVLRVCDLARDYKAMCRDYYVLQFMDPSIDTSPIAPALQVGQAGGPVGGQVQDRAARQRDGATGMSHVHGCWCLLVTLLCVCVCVLQAFFDDVLDASVSELNFKAIVDGLGNVLFQYPFRQVRANRAVNWSQQPGAPASTHHTAPVEADCFIIQLSRVEHTVVADCVAAACACVCHATGSLRTTP